jgi:Putative phage serine protease XkdF
LSELRLPDGAVYTVKGDSAANSDTAKTWDGETVKGVVVKSDDERRYTLTVAYPADSPDVGVARDGFQDFASKEAVENAAWSYMEKSRQIGAFHQDGTEGFGTLVESYIYRGPDWQVAAELEQVIKEGDWLIGVRWTPDAWNLIKSGEATGVSMQGAAKRRTPSPADVARVKASTRG